ncbi:hypothetical protein F1728_19725 [Gimesia benthica]|jgi:glucose-6-phosphate 1-dehydrogenase|uniref:Glucose-6-phosphate dehydrogenase NAD-binding domain-containing protein n=1 Tax=Gimesia benthica TaxID=2608982 RepID=A0A6I6AEI9_9PLAN|nr:hypothetical protein F1728_19725 [Gimesia benthica]
MNMPPSDAVVIFGATGDLVYKKIFPALYAMQQRGYTWCLSLARACGRFPK